MSREGTVFDDPNREAVGLDPAWVEGTGGQAEKDKPAGKKAAKKDAAAEKEEE